MFTTAHRIRVAMMNRFCCPSSFGLRNLPLLLLINQDARGPLWPRGRIELPSVEQSATTSSLKLLVRRGLATIMFIGSD
jgi:hypothetical protein